MDDNQALNDKGQNVIYSPLVTIVTVVLNFVNYIDTCIESVLKQSYPHIEHVIIDGGSTDGTVDILSSYSAKYPDRVRFISEPDKGAWDALNKGIRMATGEMIGVLGADDMHEPDVIGDDTRENVAISQVRRLQHAVIVIDMHNAEISAVKIEINMRTENPAMGIHILKSCSD